MAGKTWQQAGSPWEQKQEISWAHCNHRKQNVNRKWAWLSNIKGHPSGAFSPLSLYLLNINNLPKQVGIWCLSTWDIRGQFPLKPQQRNYSDPLCLQEYGTQRCTTNPFLLFPVWYFYLRMVCHYFKHPLWASSLFRSSCTIMSRHQLISLFNVTHLSLDNIVIVPGTA